MRYRKKNRPYKRAASVVLFTMLSISVFVPKNANCSNNFYPTRQQLLQRKVNRKEEKKVADWLFWNKYFNDIADQKADHFIQQTVTRVSTVVRLALLGTLLSCAVEILRTDKPDSNAPTLSSLSQLDYHDEKNTLFIEPEKGSFGVKRLEGLRNQEIGERNDDEREYKEDEGEEQNEPVVDHEEDGDDAVKGEGVLPNKVHGDKRQPVFSPVLSRRLSRICRVSLASSGALISYGLLRICMLRFKHRDDFLFAEPENERGGKGAWLEEFIVVSPMNKGMAQQLTDQFGSTSMPGGEKDEEVVILENNNDDDGYNILDGMTKEERIKRMMDHDNNDKK